MRKSFALHTEPHVADIGGTELKFQPEVFGDDFMDSYAELRDAQKAKGVDIENLADADPADLRKTTRALRVFLARQMLPEAAEQFLRLEVVKGDRVLKSFQDLDEAEEFAAKQKGARIVDGLRLPTRVIVELLEWVVELYGGGSAGARPTGSSNGSATRSPSRGTPGRGSSRSKA
ncbi:hypothetical protein PV518_40565 [Streptomyces sp. ND04-05B]|uniref:hypothetical protein n=1 Tax=Streptomyces sp. ND04-05B TaxID=3028693 RepID=UPI0029BCA0C9|nr:hypothetical protein [Streptomyces sp. ND04-05B]MDX3068383.1 hypothetical protein [Streptomyces sp. ND04-05B]